MKKFGNRLGFKNDVDILDARDLIKAKRTADRTMSYQAGDARDRLSSKPNTKFTMPIKTISNDKFAKKSENADFSINKPNKTNLMTNNTKKMAGRRFTDPEGSQGIFFKSTDTNNYQFKRNDIKLNVKSRDAFASQDYTTSNIRKRPFADARELYQGYDSQRVEPRVTVRSTGQSLPSFRSSIESRTLQNIKAHVDSPPSIKKTRADDLEKVKFVVVNEEKNPRPSLTTSRLSYKSLISPIQGYRIEVKNLHPQVNVDDVYELFTSLDGDLRSCNLIRPGYAEVVFRTLADAQKSIEEFHGRELDGKPMNLKLVTPAHEPTQQNIDENIMARINKIQSHRKSAKELQINKDAVFKSMYFKSTEVSKNPKKPFKFSVTL